MSLKICGAFNARNEHESFHLQLNSGIPCYMLVHFYNPVIITLNGEDIITENDACIIYSPNVPQEYRSMKGGFTNDYVKFIPDEKDFLREYNLPLNEIFYINTTYRFNEQIDVITWALTDVLVDHNTEMDNALRIVLDEMEQNRVFTNQKRRRENIVNARLCQLREKAVMSPAEWTVEKMANAFYMTRSHFSVLYHKNFGVTPSNDLLQFTMEYAKKLLRETKLSVTEISEKCGYNNSENFIRSFKKHFGITPLQYRKSLT